jgi:hypothetical protein
MTNDQKIALLALAGFEYAIFEHAYQHRIIHSTFERMLRTTGDASPWVMVTIIPHGRAAYRHIGWGSLPFTALRALSAQQVETIIQLIGDSP